VSSAWNGQHPIISVPRFVSVTPADSTKRIRLTSTLSRSISFSDMRAMNDSGYLFHKATMLDLLASALYQVKPIQWTFKHEGVAFPSHIRHCRPIAGGNGDDDAG
jgi:hypothetical protein